MTEDPGAELRASSPRVSSSPAITEQLAALAYSSQRVARRVARRRFARIGVPIVIGALALGGTGAAFASPVIRQSLGIRPPAALALPTVSPATQTPFVIPFPDCREITEVSYGGPTPMNGVGVASLAAAKQYFAQVDQAALLKSPAFRNLFGEPISIAPYTGPSASALASVQAQMNGVLERFALGQLISEGFIKRAQSLGLDASWIDVQGRFTNCGAN